MWANYAISASVGHNGINKPEDVIVIQILLNRIPSAQGGPNPHSMRTARSVPTRWALSPFFRVITIWAATAALTPAARCWQKSTSSWQRTCRIRRRCPSSPHRIPPATGLPMLS